MRNLLIFREELYIFRARIPERQFRRILRLFALDLNAVQIVALCGLSRNAIKSFRGCAKSRPVKFRAMSKQTFYLHLKECEFRLNHRYDEVYETLLNSCRKSPLNFS